MDNNDTYKVRIITSTSDFAEMEKPWNGLLSLSQGHNYFLRWEWSWNWWQVYSRDTDSLHIMVITKKAEMVAIAPFYIRKKLLGRILSIRQGMLIGTQSNHDGDVCTPYMNIICKAGEEALVVNFILKNLANNKACHEIYLPRIDMSTSVFAAIQNKASEAGFLFDLIDKYESPYIRLPATWDAYLAGLSGSMRWKIKRQRKKLRDIDGTFTEVRTSDELNERFAELIALHQKSWETRGVDGVFSDQQFSRFHHLVLGHMLNTASLELVLLYIENEPKAALYNIIYNGTTYCYQSGTDRSGKNIAFGYLAHAYCIEKAIMAGREAYDFLPEGLMDDYKRHFANRTRSVCNLCLRHSVLTKFFVRVRRLARVIYYKAKGLHVKIRNNLCNTIVIPLWLLISSIYLDTIPYNLLCTFG
jgi:CelD/BcsL family acetyltransferase involved in cellulose biosynthesis